MDILPFDLSVLRQRLAACHGIRFAREPNEFQYAAEIDGLTPDGVGHDRCAIILHLLRQKAEATTGGEFALSVARAAQTRERQGYMVHTHNPATADEIADTIRRLLP